MTEPSTYNGDSSSPPPLVCKVADRENSDKASSLEYTLNREIPGQQVIHREHKCTRAYIHGRDQGCRVGSVD